MSVDLIARARRLIAQRRGITRYFDPGLFADPARDILLDLFAAGINGRALGPRDCAAVAQVPDRTARRWLVILQDKGLIESSALHGQETVWMRLTDQGRTAMADYLTSIA